jgi:hypothetical protein
MSYQAQDLLTFEAIFAGRVRSCCVQQSESYKDDQRPAFVALAADIARGDGEKTNAFVRLSAGGPGIADKVDNGDGTIDQSKVLDADILALVQANWQTVADLFYKEDGTPISS